MTGSLGTASGSELAASPRSYEAGQPIVRSADLETARRAEVLARIEAAGVTDDRGGPLQARLQRSVEVLIANGVSQEPLQELDRALLIKGPDLILGALSQLAAVVNATRLVLAVRDSDAAAMTAISPLRRRFPAIELVPVEDVYPAGDERTLTQTVTGRQKPPSGSPEDVGALVLSVTTLLHVAEALQEKPMTHRYVQVSGEVGRPGIFRVPLGTSVATLVALSGGVTRPDTVLLMGGPLKGQPVEGQTSVTPLTASLLVLPASHGVVERLRLPPEQMLQRAASMCMGCRTCTDRCPSHLQGYAIQPHLLMRGLSLRRDDQLEVVTGASACLGCHLCDAVCPGGLSPGRLYGAVAGVLREKGKDGLPGALPGTPHALQVERGVGREWLIDRLGLRPYAPVPAPTRVRGGWQGVPIDEKVIVPEVALVLRGAEPVLAAGTRLTAGQVVALPAPGTIGTRVLSPLTGWIRKLEPNRMEIVAG